MLTRHSPGALTGGNSCCSPGALPGDDQTGESPAQVNDTQPLSTAPSTWQLLLAQNSAHGGCCQLADISIPQSPAPKQLLLWAPSKEGRPYRDESQPRVWVTEPQDPLMEAATWCQAGQMRVGFLPSSRSSCLPTVASPSKAHPYLRLNCPGCSSSLQPKSSEAQGTWCTTAS